MKMKVVTQDLKAQCKSGNFTAIKESLEILKYNALTMLVNGSQEGFPENKGYLRAFEQLEDLLLNK